MIAQVSTLVSALLAGLCIGTADCVVLALANEGGASMILALAHAEILAAVLGLVVLALRAVPGTLAYFVTLAGLWFAVVIDLGGGDGISRSAWRIPLLTVMAVVGGMGLWFGLRSAAGFLGAQSTASLRARKSAWRLLALLCAGAAYATGFLYRESYELLHLYLLLLATGALGLAFYHPLPRARVLAACLPAIAIVVLSLILGSTAHRRAQLFAHTQGARSMALLGARFGLLSSPRDKLVEAMSQGAAPLPAQYRLPVCGQRAVKPYNIILITVDALRADRLSRLGVLEAMAGTATVFSNAYAPSPATSTSLVSILSGTSALALHQLDALPATLASELVRLGYSTLSYESFQSVTRRLLPKASAKGLGFTETRSQRKAGEVVLDIVQRFESSEQPLFVYAHLLEPHAPYEQHKAFAFGNDMVGRYDSEVAFVDSQLQILLDELTRIGRRENTIIAISADHGEAFFEHGVMAHGTTLYEEMIRVPLVLSIPGTPGARRDEPVSLLDLAPTLLAALGCGWSVPTEGESLLRGGELKGWGKPVVTRQYDTAKEGSGFVRRVATHIGSDKLILDLYTGVAELYRLHDDPRESNNRIDNEAELHKALMQATLDARRRIGGLMTATAVTSLPGLAAAIAGLEAKSLLAAPSVFATLAHSSDAALAVIAAIEAWPGPRADEVLHQMAQIEGLPQRLHEGVALAEVSRAGMWALPRLVRLVLDTNATRDTRLQAITLLGSHPNAPAPVFAMLAQQDPDVGLAIAAATALCRMKGEERTSAELIRTRQPEPASLSTLEVGLFKSLLQCLGSSASEEDAAYLQVLYRDGISHKKRLAYDNLEALGRTGSNTILPLLIRQTQVGYESVRIAGLEAIAALRTPEATAFLLTYAEANKHLEQAPEHFVGLLKGLATEESVPLPTLDDDFDEKLRNAIESLARSKSGPQLLLMRFSVPDRGLALPFPGTQGLALELAGGLSSSPVFAHVPLQTENGSLLLAPLSEYLQAAYLLSF